MTCISFSVDPEFTIKSVDIIGLYMDPPYNALVISVDEKPGIQAIERSTGYVRTASLQMLVYNGILHLDVWTAIHHIFYVCSNCQVHI